MTEARRVSYVKGLRSPFLHRLITRFGTVDDCAYDDCDNDAMPGQRGWCSGHNSQARAGTPLCALKGVEAPDWRVSRLEHPDALLPFVDWVAALVGDGAAGNLAISPSGSALRADRG